VGENAPVREGTDSMQPYTPSPEEEERRYHRRLLGMLSVATFFEGYDNFVLALVLPLVLADLGGSEAQAGVIRAIVGIGAVLGFLLAAQADRIGRRRLLLITIVGYTAGTFLTALSFSLAWLTVSQFIAQIFVASEWAVAVTIVVEEFPTNRRGRSLGIVTSMNTLGGITVGILAFLGLQHTPLDWRGFFVVGIVPLIAVGFWRRRMRETPRFQAVSQRGTKHDRTNIFEPWLPQYRRNVLAVGLMNFFRFAAVASGAFWWPYYAQQEAGMSLSLSGLYLGIAGLVGAAGFIVAGRLMERWGRRPTFMVYVAGAALFGIPLFQIHSPGLMLPFLCLAIFFGLGSSAVTSAFSTEFFPTYLRSRAAAWCRNAFEIPGGIVGPLVVGVLGDHRTGAIGSIGDTMSVLFLATFLPALFIAWRYIGETRHLDMTALDMLAEEYRT
jgi:putative MFS transporter